MNAVRLLSLLVYTFGVFAYGAMLALWIAALGRVGWGARRLDGTDTRGFASINGVLLGLSFVWFVGNVASVVLSMTPRGRLLPIDLGLIFIAFIFPPVIMHVSWTEVSSSCDQPPARAWRLTLWPAYIVCVALPVWSVLVFFSRAPDDRWMPVADRVLSAGLVAAFIMAALYCMSLVMRYRQNRSIGISDRQSRRAMLILFGCMIAVFILLFVITTVPGDSGRTTALAGDSLELVAKSLPLVFVFVGTYYENRFQFFDLFVKRGVGFVMSIAVLIVWLGAILPLLQPVVGTWAAAWIFAIALIPVVVLIPWLYAVLSRALDRLWLGRKFSSTDALSHFIGVLHSATTQDQLVECAQTGLKQIFGGDAVVRLGPEAAAPGGSARADTRQVIPIRCGENVLGQFLLGRRINDMPYFSEDIHLLASLADVFSHVLENLRLQERRLEQEQRARELSLHASRSELKALRAQINPHFLFNALNSIAGLIHRDPAVADRTIEQLADVFRYALRGAESEWVMLDDEMEFVRSYLEVERARFGDRLRTDVRMDDAVRGARIPTMIVQTLVENAVKHGASAVRGPASVVVNAQAEGERLVLSVMDNGAGFDVADLPASAGARGGYGLFNVRHRLDGYFAADAALSVVRRDATTIVSVTLPLVRQEPRPHAAREVTR